jgi:hypothetical protein
MYLYLLLIMLCYIRNGNTVLFICCSNPTAKDRIQASHNCGNLQRNTSLNDLNYDGGDKVQINKLHLEARNRY